MMTQTYTPKINKKNFNRRLTGTSKQEVEERTMKTRAKVAEDISLKMQ